MSIMSNPQSFELTVFNSLYDVSTDKKIIKPDWASFKKFLENLSKLKYTKKKAPLISPAIYKDKTTRSNKNVVAWAGWAALDVDSHPFDDIEAVKRWMDKFHPEKTYLCYSTASSSQTKPKFRLVFPLTEWIDDSRKIQRFWMALNKEFAEIADQQTKDQSRMYFIPAQYTESDNNFFWSVEKNPIDPDALIRKYNVENLLINSGTSFLDMLPEKMREEIVSYREQQLKSNGKRYTWTDYRDCLFVKEEPLRNYREIALTGQEGRYRSLYNLMVSIAGAAITREYAITAHEIKDLVLEIDADIDSFYKNRKILPECERAIAFVYTNK